MGKAKRAHADGTLVPLPQGRLSMIGSDAGGQHAGAWYGDGKKYSYEMGGVGQPCVFGLKHLEYVGYQGHHSALEEIGDCCGAVRERWRHGARPGQPWDKPGEFERMLNYLGDADAPEPIPFSQQVMDQLK